jgi:RNA polymerase sigma factor (sigma-70 family)
LLFFFEVELPKSAGLGYLRLVTVFVESLVGRNGAPPVDLEPPQERSWDSVISAGELMLLVYKQMRSLIGPHPELEDLAQTALEQVLKSKFQGRSKLSTFTYAICYNVWLKHLRWHYRFLARFTVSAWNEETHIADEDDPESLLAAQRRLQRLYSALESVSPRRRAVVTMHDVMGLEVREIAEIVRSGEATVRTRLRDGRKQLRRVLADDNYFDATEEEA